jgi:hypothetical protein
VVLSDKTKARVAVKGATVVARNPALRRAAVRAGAPPAKIVARRTVRSHLARVGSAGKTVGSLVVIYGPIAAEALGLIDTPKPTRRAPAFAAGAVTGALAAYVVIRQRG